MVSLKTTIYTKLHLVVDFCVFTSQVMKYMQQWSLFLSRFLNLHGATRCSPDALESPNGDLKVLIDGYNITYFDDIVDNMKKFQVLPQQSMINEIVPIFKLLLLNPATIAAGKGPFRQLEG